MIVIKLKEAIRAHQERTGQRITYQRLSELTGISRSTLESIGTRATYNASLSAVDKICTALGCSPAELLEFSSTNSDSDA